MEASGRVLIPPVRFYFMKRFLSLIYLSLRFILSYKEFIFLFSDYISPLNTVSEAYLACFKFDTLVVTVRVDIWFYCYSLLILVFRS